MSHARRRMTLGRFAGIALLLWQCAGCSDGLFSHGASRRGSDHRPCAWLPDEHAEWQFRRSAVGDKVRRLVGPALQRAELDGWLLIERDYQRDPMLDSFGFTEPGDKAVLLFDSGGPAPRAFGFGTAPAVVAQLTTSGLFEQVLPLTPSAVEDVLARFHPRRIGIDYSARIAPADGIATGTRQFAAWLVGREYAGTFRSAENAAIAVRASRTPDEVELAKQAARCAAEIADRGLADAALDAGRTTATELSSRLAAAVRDAQLDLPSAPHVSIIRLADRTHLAWPWAGPNTDTTIAAGDLVHIELDLRYAGIAATAQRTGYVRGSWERDVPADVRRAFGAMTQVRAGLAPLFRVGATGRQVAADAAAWAQQQHLTIELTAHPIGYTAREVGTFTCPERPYDPYDPADTLADRPLQERDLQALAFHVTVSLDNGNRLTLSAGDVGEVGFGGLELLTPRND